ncbi:uncharacterized protein EV422DRAFT_573937, partial [Fimicolochytrium jonesii]|uniref:uncharacterized protein n=1 Tax=Fimicolochytrium jonesii TaxID=1396493 RepID=UPI0022FDE16D
MTVEDVQGAPQARPKRIAVIGSGISGLSAAWLLNRDPSFSVTLYEAGSYIGGHTHTVDIPTLDDPAKTVPVDTGFIVCNPVTYPNFLSLMDELDVALDKTDMSFSVSRNKGEFEWCGDGLKGVFCNAKNLNPFAEGFTDGGVWRMVYDVLRFHKEAKEIAREADLKTFDESGKPLADIAQKDQVHPLTGETLADFFAKRDYSRFFYENYIVPMTAAIWSTPADMTFDQFPVLTLFKFMRNHQLLQIGGRPKWMTVNQGSRTYVNRILAHLPDVRLQTAITSLHRDLANPTSPRITLTDNKGAVEVFDHVIIATHTDQALKILGEEATVEERKVLGGIKYVKNRLVLHRDEELMPKTRTAWAAWNYLTSSSSSPTGPAHSPTVCLTYYMNTLQPHLTQHDCGTVLATLNPLYEPDARKVLGEWEYEHPLYSPQTIRAQEGMNGVQNAAGVAFAGAWTNYGFHEDGCTSGLLAALALGCAPPPFPVHLNGGYPTTRTTLPPPAWAAAMGVKPYAPAPPEVHKMVHRVKETGKGVGTWVRMAGVG